MEKLTPKIEAKKNLPESATKTKRVKTDRGLTLKQQRFCNEYVSNGGNATAAYKAAYNSSNMLSATINRKAADLLANGKVRARLDQLIAPAAKRAALTVESHLDELGRLKALAETAGQYPVALRAEELRGKIAGFYRKIDKRFDGPTKIVISRTTIDEFEAGITDNDDGGDADFDGGE